ncbi:helix-turn-helix domain-containing protein [Leptolyngbya sp. FACHB-671]|uniref:helix-turn-helix domain-containing protein n=1 Tax=Leptolyngbya sp. FACHB-671 TaxID=2692812 RepID=UPI001682FD24|nr:helix-turn-helix domain-containing protein [Leptolyngbya sp. FACHB-671]MBD2069802.1 helix-turn-helix domain-containing protein [Leptolyngbya sp. FACHB-671]
MNPRSLSQREQHLIELYSYCQLGMTPQQFYAKWNVSQEAIASICSRSLSTVRCWFRKGRSYRRPTPTDLRHLALMDFLLGHFEQLPPELVNVLCLAEETSQS